MQLLQSSAWRRREHPEYSRDCRGSYRLHGEQSERENSDEWPGFVNSPHPTVEPEGTVAEGIAAFDGLSEYDTKE